MKTRLCFGNLSHAVTDDTLRQVCARTGSVVSARVNRDPDSGRASGYGFVEMATESEAISTLQACHGKELEGRVCTVAFHGPGCPQPSVTLDSSAYLRTGVPPVMLPVRLMSRWDGDADFDRACEICSGRSHTGVVEIGGSQALVFCDAAPVVQWRALEDRPGGVLIFWLSWWSSDDFDQIQEILKSVASNAWLSSGTEWRVTDSEVCLQESSSSQDPESENVLKFSLEPGTYTVEAHVCLRDGVRVHLYRVLPAHFS